MNSLKKHILNNEEKKKLNFVKLVKDHLSGEKNGNEIGKMLNIVQKMF